MSASIAKKTHNRLVEATVGALWVQWRAVGGMTSVDRSARSTVDPEALVLCSLALAQHERRLEDLVRDWSVVNSDLLSVQRIKNVARTFPSSMAPQLATVAKGIMRDGKDARWRTLAITEHRVARSAGNPKRRVQKATTPDLSQPAAIVLRLRLGIGIGNKADVLSFLLGSAGRSATVREIAAATGYTVHALHRTVDDLARARLIRQTDDGPARYGLDINAWRALLETDTLSEWCNWLHVYSLSAEFDYWMQETRGRSVSEYAFGVRAREFMVQYRDVFRRAGVTLPLKATSLASSGDPGALFDAATEQLEKWMTERA